MMSSNQKPLFHCHQPLIDSTVKTPTLRVAIARHRAWRFFAAPLLLTGVLGAATAMALPIAEHAEEAKVEEAFPIPPSPEEIRERAHIAAERHYNQAVEQQRTELARRISDRYKSVSFDSARQIVDAAHESGSRHDVDPLLLLSISAVESSFNPKATSSAGAIGLTQIMPRAHPEKLARIRAAGQSPFSVHASMDLGAQVFAEYHARLRNQTLALQQYNGSLRDTTRKYTNKVMAARLLLTQGLPALPPKPVAPTAPRALVTTADCSTGGKNHC